MINSVFGSKTQQYYRFHRKSISLQNPLKKNMVYKTKKTWKESHAKWIEKLFFFKACTNITVLSLIQLYFPFDIICNLAVLVPNMAVFVLLNDFNCPKITVTVYQIWVYLSYIKLYVCLMLLYLSLTWLCFVPNMTVFVLICLHLSTI